LSPLRVWNSLHAASLCFGAKKQGVNVRFSLIADLATLRAVRYVPRADIANILLWSFKGCKSSQKVRLKLC